MCGVSMLSSPRQSKGLPFYSPFGRKCICAGAVRNKQLRLLQVLPTLPDLQVAWLLLLYRASPRSNYALRIIPPELTDLFAMEHDAAVQRCFSAMLFGEDGSAVPTCLPPWWTIGLRSERLHAPAAFWAS